MQDTVCRSARPRPSEGVKLKVFVSYSRKDAEQFADELVVGLEYDGGFEVSIDRHSIIEGEEWKERLGALIADSDTVVFVISPESVKSPICRWEVAEAVQLSKRIIPALWLTPGSNPVPEQLAAVNYVRFDEGRSFMRGLTGLVRALNADVGWLREHTRLLVRAREWDAGGRPGNRLLSGSDVAEAKAWVARRPKEAPAPTAVHLDFIKASETREAERQSEEGRRLYERERLVREAEGAQQERDRATRRVVQRTFVGLAAAIMLAVVAGGFGIALIPVPSLNRAYAQAQPSHEQMWKEFLEWLPKAPSVGPPSAVFIA